MKAITVKYLGPRNTRGSRLKAFDSDRNSATVPYDHALREGSEELYRTAALALCEKMHWHNVTLVGGTTAEGYVFVMLEGSKPYAVRKPAA